MSVSVSRSEPASVTVSSISSSALTVWAVAVGTSFTATTLIVIVPVIPE